LLRITCGAVTILVALVVYLPSIAALFVHLSTGWRARVRTA
jgi:hypothetical protein